MPFVHAWKQRAFIHRQGEPVAHFKAYKNDATNSRTGVYDRLRASQSEFGHLYEAQSIPSPASAPTLAPLGSAGHLPRGGFAYATTFVTASAETDLSPHATITLGAAGGAVALSNWPLPPSALVVARRLYRARLSASNEVATDWSLVGETSDPALSTWADTLSQDAAALAPTAPTRNTTYPLALVQDFKTEMQTIDGEGIPSVLQVGNARIATMPDELYLSRADKVLLLKRRVVTEQVVERGVDQSDPLDFVPVRTLLSVRRNEGAYREGEDYTLGEDGASINWKNGRGPLTRQNYLVKYAYTPTMWFLNEAPYVPRPSSAPEEAGLELAARWGRLIARHPENMTPA